MPAFADEPATAPASAVAPEPTAPPKLPLAGSIAPLPPAATVQEGLRFDAEEKAILGGIKNGVPQLTDAGLFVLLRHAAIMPQVDGDQPGAPRPFDYYQLVDNPTRYVAEPVSVSLRVFKLAKLTSENGLDSSPRWPKDKPVWKLEGVDLTVVNKKVTKKPIILLSIQDPTPLIGEPDKGDTYSGQGRLIEANALFYKVFRHESSGSENRPPEETNYPVLVVWQLAPQSSMMGKAFPWVWTAAIASLTILIVLYFVLRKQTTRIKKDTTSSGTRVGFGGYKPYRDIEEPKPVQPPPRVDGEVDSELQAAAEQFRKERRDNGADNPR